MGCHHELKIMKKEQMIKLTIHTVIIGHMAWTVVKSLSAKHAKIVITVVIAPVSMAIVKMSDAS